MSLLIRIAIIGAKVPPVSLFSCAPALVFGYAFDEAFVQGVWRVCDDRGRISRYAGDGLFPAQVREITLDLSGLKFQHQKQIYAVFKGFSIPARYEIPAWFHPDEIGLIIFSRQGMHLDVHVAAMKNAA